MKIKSFLFVAFLLFASSSLFSQRVSVGIKGGANLGKISGQSFKDEFALAYHVGGFVTISGKKWGLQPEVLFNQVNADTATNFSQVTQFNHIGHIQLQSLTIPIMINYNLNRFLALQAGPQFGVILDQNKNLVQNGKDAFKQGNFSVAAGLQLNLLKFRVYGRFVGGLTNLNNLGSNETWQIQVIQLGIGFSLF